MGPFDLVDLSVTLGPSPSEHVPVQIERFSHHQGGSHLAELVGVAQSELEGGCGWASERLTAITHTGTHMDAPFHCTPTIGDAPARTIDEVPLEWCWAPAVCVRVDPSRAPAAVDDDELALWEQAQGRDIEPGQIVLFCTGAAALYGSARYSRYGRPLAPAVVRRLVRRGVRVVGTDAWSIDPHYDEMRRLHAAGGGRVIWAAHKAAQEGEFCILEKLRNLESLPASGFWLACFPIKIHGGSAGWVRPVAFVTREPA